MTTHRAPLAEAEAFLAQNPDIRHIHMLHTDNNGVQRGKSLRPDELPMLYEQGRPLPSSSAALTVHGEDVENTGLLWEVGDVDCLLFPVPGTLVRCPWLPGPTAQVLVMLDPELGMPSAVTDPRLAAMRLIERYHAEGLTPVMAVELEFYLLQGDSATRRPPLPVTPRGVHPHVYCLEEVEALAPFFDDLYRACDSQGLPAETAISEFGPGQLEITLHHRADALRALDEGVMFRRLIKGIAQKHGYIACFMAKPFAAHSGSGMHLHLSVNDREGRNIFASEDPAGTPALRQAIGGMAATAADFMALFAPHANSYRRFCANSYAPLTPTWGINNRTVALRIPGGPADTRHVEHRICGADANPYLAASAVLAGVHYGMTRQIDPGPPVVGNGYATTGVAALPQYWPEAIERFAASAIAKDYLTPRMVEVYAAVKRFECRQFMGEVTAQDFDWYLQTV